jgi:peroxin-12
MQSNANVDYASSVITQADIHSVRSLAKPTIFDVMAQENMNSLLRASLVHIIKWSAQNWRPFVLVGKWADELGLALQSIFELTYMPLYGALSTEHFYGMKRRNMNTFSKRIMAIAFSIVIPYFKVKLDESYEELERLEDEGEVQEEFLQQKQQQQKSKRFMSIEKLKSLYKFLMLKFYPHWHTLWSLTFWLYRIRFMLDASDYHSPLLSIIGQPLVCDFRQRSSNEIDGLLRRLLLKLNNVLTGLLFLIQFANWYAQYTSENTDESSRLFHTFGGLDAQQVDQMSTIESAKLPSKILSSSKFKRYLEDKSLCPLCARKRSNECALTTCGFLFCYPCIFKFIKENKRCPITNYPCDKANIVRIYASSSF